MLHQLKQKDSGFTLIELLVVIAIIGILSTVIIGSVRSANTRADNVAKVELSRQYINALELYYTDNSEYLNFIGEAKCLGAGISSCQGGGLTPDSSLNAELNKYIPGPPADQYDVTWGRSDMTGITYVCDDGNDGDGVCSEYSLLWYLDGVNQKCGQAADNDNFPFFGTPTLTQCEFRPN